MIKYNIIYADPPWDYSSNIRKKEYGPNRNIKEKYPTMAPGQIKSLPIGDISADDAALFLWTTDSHLKLALEVMESWGFKYTTIAFVWLKLTSKGNYCFSMGPWTGKSTEICLLGTKGKAHSMVKDRSVRQLVIAERREHSRKPDEVRDRIVQMFGNIPRIELFAREKPKGWHVWGNEVKSDVQI